MDGHRSFPVGDYIHPCPSGNPRLTTTSATGFACLAFQFPRPLVPMDPTPALTGNAEEFEGSMEWSRPPEKQDALRKLDVKPSDDSPPWIMGSTNKVETC